MRMAKWERGVGLLWPSEETVTKYSSFRRNRNSFLLVERGIKPAELKTDQSLEKEC